MPLSPKVLQIMHDAKAAWETVKPIKEGYDKISEHIERLDKNIDEALKGNPFISDNDDINTLRALGKATNHRLAEWARKDENYWIDWSKVNVLMKETIPLAVARLEQQTRQLEGLEKIAPVALTFLQLINFTDKTKIDYWLGFATSLKIGDGIARDEARTEFLAWGSKIAIIKPRIENATKIVRRQMW
jgi:hypothetical protein